MQHTDIDREGIVMALLLDGTGGARDVGWSEIEGWRPEREGLWLQLDAASPRVTKWLALQGAGLATLGVDDRRPRFEVIDPETVRIGVRAWLPTLQPGAARASVTNICLQPTRAIVISRGLLAELPEIRSALAAGTGPRTIPALLLRQLEQIAQRLTDGVDDL